MKDLIMKIIGIAKNALATMGPLKIIFGAVSIVGTVITLIKAIKAIIKKIKNHKKSKAPETMMDCAMVDKETREENPVLLNKYNASVAKSACNLVGKKPKNGKKRRKNSELTTLSEQLSAYNNKYTPVKKYNCDNVMPLSEYAAKHPEFKKAIMAY